MGVAALRVVENLPLPALLPAHKLASKSKVIGEICLGAGEKFSDPGEARLEFREDRWQPVFLRSLRAIEMQE